MKKERMLSATSHALHVIRSSFSYLKDHLCEKERKDKKTDEKVLKIYIVSVRMIKYFLILGNSPLYKLNFEEYIYSHKSFIKFPKKPKIAEFQKWSGGTNFVHRHLG